LTATTMSLLTARLTPAVLTRQRRHMAYKELMIGAGSSVLTKRLKIPNHETFADVTTLDINPDHKPDVVWDLTKLPTPFEADSFDEIHAYDLLPHTGAQGDWRFFFAQFSDFWRVLKPGGHFFATVPTRASPWAWADPSTTRLFLSETLVFLDQTQYTKQVGKT